MNMSVRRTINTFRLFSTVDKMGVNQSLIVDESSFMDAVKSDLPSSFDVVRDSDIKLFIAKIEKIHNIEVRQLINHDYRINKRLP